MAPFRPQSLSFWGWGLLIWGAPWSPALMSAATGLVGIGAIWAWFIGRRQPKDGSTTLSISMPETWLVLLMAWQLISLSWSENVEFGLHILSIQMAMLVLVWAWKVVPLRSTDLAGKWMFRSVAIALTVILIFGGWKVWNGQALLGRDWTPWMSHIRISMMASVAWVWGSKSHGSWGSWIFLVLWGAFIWVTGSLTGFLLLPLSLMWSFWGSASKNAKRLFATSGLIAAAAATVLLVIWLQPVPLPMDVDELPTHTSQGNPYTHHPDRVLSEGGHRLHLFVCRSEWDDAWAQVSDQPLDLKNERGFQLQDRLLRYLTSKGWPKDREHILKLTPDEVQAIENGATTVQVETGLKLRISQLKRGWEIWQDGGDASGHSILQRIEHWSVGAHAWLQSPWVGHGAGDTQIAMNQGYDALHSSLAPQHRHRAHMQHLTWAISGGLFGWLLWIGFSWTWWRQIGLGSRQALWGGLVVALSCFFEDTWESQAGIVVSFLALFASWQHKD